MKKCITWFSLAALAAVLLLLAGCGGSGGAEKSVAVSFANSSSSWQKNGQTIQEMLEKKASPSICSLPIPPTSRLNR